MTTILDKARQVAADYYRSIGMNVEADTLLSGRAPVMANVYRVILKLRDANLLAREPRELTEEEVNGICRKHMPSGIEFGQYPEFMKFVHEIITTAYPDFAATDKELAEAKAKIAELEAKLKQQTKAWKLIRQWLGLPSEHPDGSDIEPAINALLDAKLKQPAVCGPTAEEIFNQVANIIQGCGLKTYRHQIEAVEAWRKENLHSVESITEPLRKEIDELTDKLECIRESTECPPDCDLLKWASTLHTAWLHEHELIWKNQQLMATNGQQAEEIKRLSRVSDYFDHMKRQVKLLAEKLGVFAFDPQIMDELGSTFLAIGEAVAKLQTANKQQAEEINRLKGIADGYIFTIPLEYRICFVAWYVCRHGEVIMVGGFVVRRVTKDWYVATREGAK